MDSEKNLKIAIYAAILAGDEVMKVYEGSAQTLSIEKKSDSSPLTIADKRSHQIIYDVLSQSGLPVLSEEGAEIPFSERENWTSFWIVDPLDGTKEFIKRNGEFTVNIGLVKNNLAIGGVIYVPVSRTLYFGWPGYGSKKIQYVNTVSWDSLINSGILLPLNCSRSNFTIVVSRSHINNETNIFIDKIRCQKENVEVISAGSSLKICLVAENKADIYPRFGTTMEWDTAAGHAIVKHAGKNIYLIDEKTELSYNKENLFNPWFVAK